MINYAVMQTSVALFERRKCIPLISFGIGELNPSIKNSKQYSFQCHLLPSKSIIKQIPLLTLNVLTIRY